MEKAQELFLTAVGTAPDSNLNVLSHWKMSEPRGEMNDCPGLGQEMYTMILIHLV